MRCEGGDVLGPARAAVGASLWCLVVLAIASVDIGRARAADAGPERRTAVSQVGSVKMPAGFAAFDWVNPEAPKGGVVQYAVTGSFDSLNPFSVKGEAARSTDVLLHETLMTPSLDEPATAYGLIAQWIAYPTDVSSVTFGLDPAARFQDGSAITVEDVIFSFEQLKRVSPQVAALYKSVVAAERTGEREVTFRFDRAGNRDLPFALAGLTVLSKAYWTGKSAAGVTRDLNEPTLEPPVGSGPYRVAAVDPGRRIVFERVADYWANDLPVVRGQWNFDRFVHTYYRDSTPAFEAFKVGQVDFWFENRAKAWATGYDFQAIHAGRVKKEAITVIRAPQMQGFVLNMRRPVFQDVRVRRALGLALDFEWANKNIFFELYRRTTSYFIGTEMDVTGTLPTGRELEILEGVRDRVPQEVFTTPWTLPVNRTAEDFRRHLAEASRLLDEAGYRLVGGVRVDASGRRLEFEMLLDDESFERIVLPYKAALDRIGVRMSVRLADPTQVQQREKTRDFDALIGVWRQTFSPGNEQRDMWSSEAADVEGSQNSGGIKNPAVDKIIDHIIFARDRADLVAAVRALDRVLLWNAYIVPQWHVASDRIAYWDIFGRPPRLPAYDTGFERIWWIEPAKAAALGPQRGR